MNFRRKLGTNVTLEVVNQPFNCGLGSSLSFVRAGVMVLSEVMASC
jgi:homoserine kinase